MANNFLLIIFGLAGVLAVALVILLIFWRPTKKTFSREKFRLLSEHIILLSGSNETVQLKQAVIEADILLAEILASEVAGKTLGERLINARDLISDRALYQLVWEAHKLRNSLVHDVDKKVSVEECRRALNVFRRVYQFLGYN
jgi:hypothetical protein